MQAKKRNLRNLPPSYIDESIRYVGRLHVFPDFELLMEFGHVSRLFRLSNEGSQTVSCSSITPLTHAVLQFDGIKRLTPTALHASTIRFCESDANGIVHVMTVSTPCSKACNCSGVAVSTSQGRIFNPRFSNSASLEIDWGRAAAITCC